MTNYYEKFRDRTSGACVFSFSKGKSNKNRELLNILNIWYCSFYLIELSEYNVYDMNDPIAGQVVCLYDVAHSQVAGDGHLMHVTLMFVIIIMMRCWPVWGRWWWWASPPPPWPGVWTRRGRMRTWCPPWSGASAGSAEAPWVLPAKTDMVWIYFTFHKYQAPVNKKYLP